MLATHCKRQIQWAPGFRFVILSQLYQIFINAYFYAFIFAIFMQLIVIILHKSWVYISGLTTVWDMKSEFWKRYKRLILNDAIVNVQLVQSFAPVIEYMVPLVCLLWNEVNGI